MQLNSQFYEKKMSLDIEGHIFFHVPIIVKNKTEIKKAK